MLTNNYPDLASLIRLSRVESSGISLRANQILKAIVLIQDAEGNTLLRLNNKEVQTQIKTPLSEGQTLLLKVEQGGPRPLLKLVNTLIPTENSLKLLSTVLLENRPGNTTVFRPGHLIQALVQSVDIKQNVALRINNNLFQGRTQFPVSIGQQLSLQVVDNKQGIALKILSTAPPPDIVSHTLRNILPRSDYLAPVLARIKQLVTQTHAPAQSGTIANPVATATKLESLLSSNRLVSQTALPQRIAQLTHELLVRIPDKQQVTNPVGLKQAIQDSGIFLENRLAKEIVQGHVAVTSHPGGTNSHAHMSVNKDLKAGFMKLLINVFSLLQTTGGTLPVDTLQKSLESSGLLEKLFRTLLPGHTQGQQANSAGQGSESKASLLRTLLELFRQIESGVARVQLHQISSMPTEDRPQTVLTMELPVRHGEHFDVIELRITRDADENGEQSDEQQQWTATLIFNLRELGQVRASITVVDKMASTRFWTEKASTAALIDEHLSELRDNLSKAGLNVGSLECSQGIPAEKPGFASSRVLFNTTA